MVPASMRADIVGTPRSDRIAAAVALAVASSMSRAATAMPASAN